MENGSSCIYYIMYVIYGFNDRRSLDLFANVVHVTSLPGCETKHKDLDIVIIRESTEGEYSCLEHEVWSIMNLRDTQQTSRINQTSVCLLCLTVLHNDLHLIIPWFNDTVRVINFLWFHLGRLGYGWVPTLARVGLEICIRSKSFFGMEIADYAVKLCLFNPRSILLGKHVFSAADCVCISGCLHSDPHWDSAPGPH